MPPAYQENVCTLSDVPCLNKYMGTLVYKSIVYYLKMR